jgi:hypothetical protein
MSSTIRLTATAKIRSLFAAKNVPGNAANTSLETASGHSTIAAMFTAAYTALYRSKI